MTKLCLLLVGLPLLTQCADMGAPRSLDPPPLDSIASQFTADLLIPSDGNGDVSKVSVPILRIPALEVNGTKPKYAVADDGSYIASYQKGGDYFQITGTPRRIRPTGFTKAGELNILGRSVPFFSAGNEDPEYRTEPVVITAPDGRTGTYSVLFGGKKGIINRVPKVGW